MRFLRFGVFLFCWGSSVSHAEFVVFPMLDFFGAEGQTVNLKSIIPAATLYYTEEGETFSVLAEAEISEKAQNLERLQVGIKLSPSNTLWLGRGHTPYGYWNTQFHHGAYFQNSISSPGSISGELFNRHLTGLEWDYDYQLQNQASIKMEYMGGYAPNYDELEVVNGMFRRGSFEDFDILEPKANEHDLGHIIRLSYQGFINPENSLGTFYARNKFQSASEFKQSYSGAFFNLQGTKWRALGEYYWVNNQINRSQDIRYGWLQAEYNQGEVTWVGRYEKSNGDMYNFLLASMIDEKAVFGVRYDFAERQAIKIEFSQIRHKDNELRIEWSGYLK